MSISLPSNQIQLTPLRLDDASALLAFELENRAWFESWVAPRGDAFYQIDAVRHSVSEFLEQQKSDLAYAYLIRVDEQIIGRLNLRHVERADFNRANLGYRIGAAYTGKGIASQAVAQALHKAFTELGFWRIEATVSAANKGSARVLERNGFRLFGRAEQCLNRHGVWEDLLYYECRAPSGPVLKGERLLPQSASISTIFN